MPFNFFDKYIYVILFVEWFDDLSFDGANIVWLEKQYSLWKPKIKAKPKNKFPW
jgi:hypothetical protein